MALSKNQLKLITSLSQKKYRQKHKLFIAEGIKVVDELLNSSLKVNTLFVTEDYKIAETNINMVTVSESELKKISQLKTPNKVLGLFEIPEINIIENDDLTVVLDAINDPGNLGTIIRLCDWFGIQNLICSTDTVDCYNSKVVQASMGSLTRVSIVYTDIDKYLKESKKKNYIADMDGEEVYKTKLPKSANLIMGNEANGVSEKVRRLVNANISIPRFGEIQATESLNVATATAILLSEFRRG